MQTENLSPWSIFAIYSFIYLFHVGFFHLALFKKKSSSSDIDSIKKKKKNTHIPTYTIAKANSPLEFI